MDTGTIRDAVLRRPFQPFVLRMNDGRKFPIPHPEYVAVSRRVVMVVNAADESGVYLEPVLIGSLHYPEKLSSPGPKGGNGETGKGSP